MSVLLNCSDQGSGDTGALRLLLKSRALSPSSSLQQIKAATSTQCHVEVDGTTIPGRCTTPLSVSGYFNEISLEGNQTPARLLGGGTSRGVKAIFQHSFFDLLTSPSIPGEDNLQDQGGSFMRLNLKLQMLETVFRGTAQFARTFYVRHFFVASIPSQEHSLQGCLDAPALSDADLYGTLIKDVPAQAGDLMVCVGTPQTACLDYTWIDATSGTASLTRPQNPLQVNGDLLMKPTTCSGNGATWGYGNLTASLPNVLQASAHIKKGQKIYTIQGLQGSKPQLEIDLDADAALFLPSSLGFQDLSTMTEAEILQHLDQLLLKPIFVGHRKTSAAPDDDGSMLSATVTTSMH